MDAVTAQIVTRIRRNVSAARGALARYQMLIAEDQGLAEATQALSEAINDMAALERRIFGQAQG